MGDIMKKHIFLIPLFMGTTFAKSTNDQILKKLDQIKYKIQTIEQNQQLIKVRFEEVDKHFEVMGINALR